MPGGTYYSDDAFFMYLQGSTQIDALGHIWYDDQMYNGFDAGTTNGTLRRCSVKPMADHGIVGRGVLLDVAKQHGPLQPNQLITLEMMLATAEAQGVELRKHDILLFHTGWMPRFYEGGMEALMGGGEPGISDEKELIAWFHEMEIAAQGSDTIGGERSFSDISNTTLPLHGALLRNLGVPFLEMLWLEDLAADCAQDGQYDFLLVVSPLKVHGGTGSPINPVAIK
jgi:kynurenine formamidase